MFALVTNVKSRKNTQLAYEASQVCSVTVSRLRQKLLGAGYSLIFAKLKFGFIRTQGEERLVQTRYKIKHNIKLPKKITDKICFFRII